MVKNMLNSEPAGTSFTPRERGLRSDFKTENILSDESYEVVEFLLGQNLFAISLLEVKEIVNYIRITRLPNSPPYIKGIIDLRGEITTIVDLHNRLSLSDSQFGAEEESRIIVLDDRRTNSKIGILVDEVLSVSSYTKNQVDVTATSGEEESYIIGIIRKSTREEEKEVHKLIIWLDIYRLISSIEKI